MYIRATFINRKSMLDSIELAHAWDEYQIDNWPEGYKESLEKELASFGDDIEKVVTVDLRVSDTSLLDLFSPPLLDVDMVDPMDTTDFSTGSTDPDCVTDTDICPVNGCKKCQGPMYDNEIRSAAEHMSQRVKTTLQRKHT